MAQQLTADVAQRQRAARDCLEQGRTQAALDTLRLAQTVVRSADIVEERVRAALERRIEAQLLSTVRAEERRTEEDAEALRRAAEAEQRSRSLDRTVKDQDTVGSLMVQFDRLMSEGQSNTLALGGEGDVGTATTPFSDARRLAQTAQALAPQVPAPRAGNFVAQARGFLEQSLAFEQLKEHRALLSLQDVSRANVPEVDTRPLAFPPDAGWRDRSEQRTARWGKGVDLSERDPKTKAILARLEEPVSMSFPRETPLEDVLKYIKLATTGANGEGIPIYVDPVGLQEADRTLTSPVTLDLEGVPLKTTLRLLLKQLGLSYTVKEGLVTITSADALNTPTEMRVYPVADLAIIPGSLMGNRGAGGAGASGLGNRGASFGGGPGGFNGNGVNPGFRSLPATPVRPPVSSPARS